MDFLLDLEKRSFVTTNHLFSENETLTLLSLVQTLQKEQSLKKAGVGKNKELLSRGDSIFWLEESTAPSFLFPRLKEAMFFLNRRFFLNLKNFEFHLAHYPKGSAYDKHVDVFQSDSSRTISFVHYLNPEWAEVHAGQLKLYLENERSQLVLPTFGTSIFFLSTLPHEVLATQEDRYSLTGWFKT